MTKQEEIREKVIVILQVMRREDAFNEDIANEILEYLHSQGVVIKGYPTGTAHGDLYETEPLIWYN